MLQRLRFLLEQIAHDLRVGLLLRPGVIIAALAAAAVAFTRLEEQSAAAAAFAADVAPFRGEPGTAHVVLATIASGMMTVVSIVYSLLIMALSLASIQFSPRILARFVRDDVSQTTLGLFVGTFLYCLIVVPEVRIDPPFVPVLSVSVALLLALVALGYLVYFIHHIARSIQANHIIDDIAAETELVIDAVFPAERDRARGQRPQDDVAAETPVLVDVRSVQSGYVQLIDGEGLEATAAARGLSVVVDRSIGDYVAAGARLLRAGPPADLTQDVRDELLGAFDIGPVRTMQEDAEFGVRQIVDIGLKAISPAVNDPSTANTCIDQLGRLLVRVASRPPRAPRFERVSLPGATFEGVLDVAFNQLRQYGRSDLSVSIRLLSALGDIASACVERSYLDRVEHHARLVAAGCGEHVESDRAPLAEQFAALQRALEAARAGLPEADPAR